MGLIQKKDEKDVLDDIQIIGRGEGPDGPDPNPVDLIAGESAEHIAAGTTAAQVAADAEAQMFADADDEALKEGIDDDADASPVADHHAKRDASRKAKAKAKASHRGPHHKLPANHGVLFAALAIALVIVAGIGGYFIGNGGFGAKGTGTATLTEDQLNDVVATWNYNGQKHEVTAKEVIEAQYSLDNAKDSDGNYAAPTSETIISYIRNEIMLAEADSRNITVSNKEIKAYAESTIGTSSYSDMADQYGVTEDQAKQIVKQNAIVNKLYEQVVPDSSKSTAPTAPTEPADGNTSTASKEYADYIIKLAGDEWDSSKGTWASEDGPYYAALKDQQFTVDSATYEQAQTAYYVAYQQYTQSAQSLKSTWSSFANGLYAKANVDIYGLYV